MKNKLLRNLSLTTEIALVGLSVSCYHANVNEGNKSPETRNIVNVIESVLTTNQYSTITRTNSNTNDIYFDTKRHEAFQRAVRYAEEINKKQAK